MSRTQTNNPTPQNPESGDRLATIEEKLDALLGRLAAQDRRFFGVDEAAKYASLSPESIRRLLAGGRLTALRPVTGRVLIDRRELDSLILASNQRPRRRRGVYVRERSSDGCEER